MAETDWTAAELASLDRASKYNVGDYDAATNPYGFGEDGYLFNQMRQADDVGVVARGVRRMALSASVQAVLAHEDAANTKLDRIATAQDVVTSAQNAQLAQQARDRAEAAAAGLNLPSITAANAGQFLQVNAAGTGYQTAVVDTYSAALVNRVARASNVTLQRGQKGQLIDIVSGTFTQTFQAAATLGAGWWCYIRNSGTGSITLDPNGSEPIDGLSSYVMYPGEARLVLCTGVALFTLLITPGVATFLQSGNFVWPPGISGAVVECAGGGGGGGGGTTGDAGGGGGGGGRTVESIPPLAPGTQTVVTVGSGGNGGQGTAATITAGISGGASSFGDLVSVMGGVGGSISGAGTAGNGGGSGVISLFAAPGGTTPMGSAITSSGLDSDRGGARGGNTNTRGRTSLYAGGGGGGGTGSLSTGGQGVYDGGSSGTVQGGASGLVSPGAGAANNGGAGADGVGAFAGGGGGGGGNGGVLGGNGGNGGLPSGGGGGGGRSNTTGGGGSVGGSGGNGGNGRVTVRMF